MTSVPKPLKFLRPFYGELERIREAWDETKLGDEKVSLFSLVELPPIRVRFVNIRPSPLPPVTPIINLIRSSYDILRQW